MILRRKYSIRFLLTLLMTLALTALTLGGCKNNTAVTDNPGDSATEENDRNEDDTPGDTGNTDDSENTNNAGEPGDTEKPGGSEGTDNGENSSNTENPGNAATPDEPAPEPEPEPELITITNTEEIKDELRKAMDATRQPWPMDISAVTLGEYPEIEIKNLYYSLLSENRAYCTAYDVTAEIADGILTATLSYMPYVTGEFPEGFEGTEIASLTELIAVAEANLGAEPKNIRITNQALTPDEMNQALQQAGGAYVVCQLNNDATAIRCMPATGFTMEECLTYVQECNDMAAQIVAELVTDDMSDLDKAHALYDYLTETVRYDFMYYSDKANMSYHSQTAYGALKDGLAICGGYSHALKLLFEHAGITCYNVSGEAWNEYHMWSIARIDGEWKYFDATGDRGSKKEWWKYFGVDATTLQKDHTWDGHTIDKLTGEAGL